MSKNLSDLTSVNIEALCTPEHDAGCREWVTKSCYSNFSNRINPYVYYASCAGVSQSGGMVECGAVTSKEPMNPYSAGTCLQCVQTW